MANLPHKLYIYQNTQTQGATPSLVFEGNMMDSLNFQLSFEWSGMIDAKFLTTLSKGAAALREFGKDSSIPGVSKLTAQVPQNLSAGTSLTKMVGGYPDYLRPTTTCRIYIKNNIRDIYEKLKILHSLTTPELGQNISTFEAKIVTVFFGDYFTIQEAVIQSVTEAFSKTFVMGHPAWCDVTIAFSSVQIASKQLLDGVFTQISVLPPR